MQLLIMDENSVTHAVISRQVSSQIGRNVYSSFREFSEISKSKTKGWKKRFIDK